MGSSSIFLMRMGLGILFAFVVVKVLNCLEMAKCWYEWNCWLQNWLVISMIVSVVMNR